MNKLHAIGIPNQDLFFISKLLTMQFLLKEKWKTNSANLTKKCKQQKTCKKLRFFFEKKMLFLMNKNLKVIIIIPTLNT
jgi:hypothetical protein